MLMGTEQGSREIMSRRIQGFAAVIVGIVIRTTWCKTAG